MSIVSYSQDLRINLSIIDYQANPIDLHEDDIEVFWGPKPMKLIRDQEFRMLFFYCDQEIAETYPTISINIKSAKYVNEEIKYNADKIPKEQILKIRVKNRFESFTVSVKEIDHTNKSVSKYVTYGNLFIISGDFAESYKVDPSGFTNITVNLDSIGGKTSIEYRSLNHDLHRESLNNFNDRIIEVERRNINFKLYIKYPQEDELITNCNIKLKEINTEKVFDDFEMTSDYYFTKLYPNFIEHYNYLLTIKKADSVMVIKRFEISIDSINEKDELSMVIYLNKKERINGGFLNFDVYEYFTKSAIKDTLVVEVSTKKISKKYDLSSSQILIENPTYKSILKEKKFKIILEDNKYQKYREVLETDKFEFNDEVIEIPLVSRSNLRSRIDSVFLRFKNSFGVFYEYGFKNTYGPFYDQLIYQSIYLTYGRIINKRIIIGADFGALSLKGFKRFESAMKSHELIKTNEQPLIRFTGAYYFPIHRRNTYIWPNLSLSLGYPEIFAFGAGVRYWRPGFNRVTFHFNLRIGYESLDLPQLDEEIYIDTENKIKEKWMPCIEIGIKYAF
jgi:hypothetical protein